MASGFRVCTLGWLNGASQYMLDNVQDHDETLVTVLCEVLQSLFLASDGTLVSFNQHLSSLPTLHSILFL